jgi:hypothetical protein
LCQKALAEDHKYLKVSIKYTEILIEAKAEIETIVENIEFWTLMYRSPEIHQLRLKLIEFLKNNENSKAKFILRKMVMFPNEHISEYLKEIPNERPVENLKLHEDIQVKFENALMDEKKLISFLVNQFKPFLEKVSRGNTFEYTQLYFE